MRANKLIAELDLESEIAGIAGPHSFFIGRSEDCYIQLDDKQVSRLHAEVIFDNEKWALKRLSQSTPIVVNGTPCSEKDLVNGDIITIGPFAINVILSPIRPMGVIFNEDTKAVTTVQTESINKPLQNQTTAPPPTKTSAVVHSTDVTTESQIDTLTTAAEEEPQIVSEDDKKNDDLNEVKSSDSSMFGDNMGNTAAPAGEVSSAEVPMTFGEEPVEDVPSENYDNDDSMLPTNEDGRTQVIKTFAKFDLEIVGEYAPYDKYIVEAAETFIGRDANKCQIVLKDPEVSSVHAVIRKNNIICVIEDLQSANGTILNAKRINKADLTTGDEFIIGSTTFTFKVHSELISEEENRLMPVDENQEIEVIEEVEESVDFENTGITSDAELSGGTFGAPAEAQEKSLIKRIWKDPVKRKKAIYVLLALVVLWVLFDEGEKPAPKKAPVTKEGTTKETSNLLPGVEGTKVVDESKDPNKPSAATEVKRPAKKLTKDEAETVEASYLLSKDLYEKGKYREALFELERIFAITPDYKNARDMRELAKQGLARLEQLEEQRRKEQEKRERQEKIKVLVDKAKEATKDKKSEVAEVLFTEILKLDPENYDVPQMKLELDAWKREQERLAREQAMKEAERAKKVSQLSPGKIFYLKKEWYKAIVKLEEFSKIVPMDEDLTKEGADMLTDSRAQLQSVVNPLIGKARSLKEGQDLKGAYETYLQIIAYDPMNAEALNEMAEIRDTLFSRARKIYREAIISESLSLFEDAKEKFQEVQQISPSDSEYYKKATEKLKDYTD